MPKSTPKCTLRGFLRNGISGGPKLGHLLAPYKQQFVGTSAGTMCSISQKYMCMAFYHTFRFLNKMNTVCQIELDRVYPNSKTRRVLAIFPNPNLKNLISKDCQNPNTKKT